MKQDNETRLTPAQTIALRRLGAAPDGFEVKGVHYYQPDRDEVGDPRLVRMLVVQVETGYPDDEEDFRRALRERRTYLVSPRGRIEPWTLANGKVA